MPDLQQRISDILREHQKGFFGSEYGNCAACTCDWKGAGWADHAAEVLMSELGLSVEWALARGSGCQTVMTEQAARDAALRRPESSSVVSRYVTAWRDE